MEPDALHEAEREARAEAAPFAIIAAGALALLALVSQREDWRLSYEIGWWVWLLAAAPYVVLSVMLATGLGRVRDRARRRRIAVAVLGVIVALGLLETALLVASLVAPSTLGISGPQLLQTGATIWLANVIAFGLAFWELDCGGPVRRALADRRRTPDIQFPQDENPDLAGPGWAPHLVDYLYLSTTNSIAFSPTDAMPLTRPAKALMAVEAAISIIAILLIAARAVNILHA